MARSSSSSSGSSDQENSGGTIKNRSHKEKGSRSSSSSSEERKKKVQESRSSKVGNSRSRAGSPSIKKQRHKARSESRDKEERSQKAKKDVRLKKREDSSESSEEETEETQRSRKQKHKERSESREKEERSQKPKKDSRLKKTEDSSESSVEETEETQRSWKNSSKLKAEEERKFSPGRSRNQGKNRDTSPAKRSRTSPSRISLDTRRNRGRERDTSPGKRPRASLSRVSPDSRRNQRRDRHTSSERKPRASPSRNYRGNSPDKREKDVTSSRGRSPVSRKLTSKEREKVSHKPKEDTRQKKRQDTSESSDEETTDVQRPWKDSSRSEIEEKRKLSPHTRRDRGRDRDTSPGKRSRAVPTKNVRAKSPSDRRIKERDASLSPRRSENHSVRRGQDQNSRKVDESRRRQSPFGRISPDQTRQRRPAARRNDSRSPRRDRNERRTDRSLQRGKQMLERHEPSDEDSAVEASPPPTLREAEISRSPVRRGSPPPKSTDDKPQSSRKRRHHSGNSSDPGFSDTETKKRQRGEGSSGALVKEGSEDDDKTPVYKPRVYRDLDNPEPESETLQRYWDVNVVAVPPTETTPPRSRTPEQVGGRYWEPEPSEEQLKKELEEFRREKMKAKENAEKEKVELGEKKEGNVEKEKPELKRKADDILTTRTGGAYIPPAKLRLMQQQISDKSSPAYQRLAWEALKKSIHGLINKINVSNIALIVRQLFKENIARGRGLLCRSIMQAQASSQTFSHVYAALVAVINTKFPNIGELLLKRLILQFKRGFKRNDKVACTSSAKFIGHLVNQQVAHELIALEILTLLLEKPTDDSVEIAIGFLKEVGMKLTEVSPRGLTAVFESLRHVLNEAALDKRVQYMIEVMYQVRKDGFKDNPAVMEELDLVEETDQMTHILSLEEVLPGASEDLLNVFKHDPDYVANEEKYDAVRKEILGDDEGSGDEGSGESGSGSEEGSDDEEGEEKKQTIIDETETNLTALRRTIYLTIQSSLDHNEAAHKLMRMQLKPGQEAELCNMILDCCAQQRTYEKFFGLLAQRFCQIKREYISPFEQLFRDSYDTIHRIDIGKLRNVAKLFAHLLFSDAISWDVLSHIHLNEDETTSSSRIFIKILFQELAEYMGLQKLNDRLKDASLQPYFEGIFPRDNPKHTRFSINFFTSIGLGGLTDTLREHLATMPKPTAIVPPIPKVQVQEEEASSSSDASSSDSDSSDSDSSDSDSSTDSEVERRVRQRLKELRTREEEAAKKNKESDRDKKKKQRDEEERRSRREKEREMEKEDRKRQEREEEKNRKREKEREKDRKREKEGRSDIKERKKRDERRERPRKTEEKEKSRRRRSES